MARERSNSELTWEAGARPAVPSAPNVADPAHANAAEFRELARQRRFVRTEDERTRAATVSLEGAPGSAPRTVAASANSTAHPTSHDIATLANELTRATDRLVSAREELARQTQRADAAESELASARSRLMAANVLVQDAQRAAHEAAEQTAHLTGRNEALQEALELAVHAGIVTRWRWRRKVAQAKRARQAAR